MTLPDLFYSVADLLKPPGMWTQNAVARRDDGRIVNAKHKDAVCFCFEGAIVRVAKGDEGLRLRAFRFAREILGTNLFTWNDVENRTQLDVVSMARSLGRRAEREGR